MTGSGRLDIYQRGGDSFWGGTISTICIPLPWEKCFETDRNTVLPPEEFWQKLKNGQVPAGAGEGLRDLETLTGFPEPLFSGSEVPSSAMASFSSDFGDSRRFEGPHPDS